MDEDTNQDQNMNPKTTDEECLESFIKDLTTRVSISTGFVPDEETGILTHQLLKITCGEFSVVSVPEPLDIPLMPAPTSLTGVTIN